MSSPSESMSVAAEDKAKDILKGVLDSLSYPVSEEIRLRVLKGAAVFFGLSDGKEWLR